MSEINQNVLSDKAPLFDDVDIMEQEEDDDDDLFAPKKVASDTQSNPVQPMKPTNLPELPTLQLSLNPGPPPTPLDESFVDITSPSPTISSQPTPVFNETEIIGDGLKQFIEIKVRDGVRMGDGMAAFISYKIDTRTNISIFKKQTFSVQRRFSDFLGLHDKLVDKYLRLGRVIPPAPEKSVIGMTKIKMSNQEKNTSSNIFIERRRASLERYLNRTANHPVLCIDPDFRDFLKADIELPKATNTSALSGAGVLRLFNKVGETVNKITYRMDENDQWFEEKIQELECLEAGLRKLHGSIESLVISRRDLSLLTSTVAKSVAILSSSEEHNTLKRCLAQLSELKDKLEIVHADQANTDLSILCELLKDYVALIGAIKDVFHERVKVFQNWQHAQLMLNKKREYKAKMELANKTEKGSLVGSEIIEWEAKVERCQEEFDNISKMIKKEVEMFEVNRVSDFKESFIKDMEVQMKHQQQLIKFWEKFLPEAKAIS